MIPRQPTAGGWRTRSRRLGQGAAEQPHQPLDLLGFDGPAERTAGERDDANPGGRVQGEVRAGSGRDVPRRVGLLENVGGRRQVLLHEDRRDEQSRGVVVESPAAAAVGGEGVGRMSVDAEQVAGGVIVLPAGQPLNQGGSRIAGPLDRVEDRLDRVRRVLAIIDVGTGPAARRRHGPLDQGIDDPEPEIGVAAERLFVRELRQVDVALRFLRTVTPQTVLLDERPDVLVEAVTGA